MRRPPEAAPPGEVDSAPDTTAAYVGDVAREVALAGVLDDALDPAVVEAIVSGGIRGHSGGVDRRGVPNSAADDEGVDEVVGTAADPKKLRDPGRDIAASYGGGGDSDLGGTRGTSGA